MTKIQWNSLLLGVAVGAIGLYVLEHRSLGIFIDRVNPDAATILNGGGHSIGG